MAHGIGGLPGGGVNPEGGAIRLPGGATDGSRGITQQTSRAQILLMQFWNMIKI